jgi:hypothetical protein
MKTAIDYLVEKLAENGIIHSFDISKAKEMFEQQIIEHGVKCYVGCCGEPDRIGDEVSLEIYNETFKTDKG